jgi:A/G-specific adenine glycosylase
MNSCLDLTAWTPTSSDINLFQTEVLNWFEFNGRDLPWRRTRNPYAILVSELMLQQTQVLRVLPYYATLLEAFPTVHDLAVAPAAAVLRLWQGLGYNRRAVYLQRSAQAVISHFDGVFPRTVTELESLPGVGPYTARAVGCFAFELQVALVETNVRKALLYFAQRLDGPLEFNFDSLATSLLPTDRAWTWNQALIDFGAIRLAELGFRGKRSETRMVPSERFESTDRYWRGRIIAALCNYPDAVPTSRLLRELPPGDERRLLRIIEALDSEGLVSLDPNTDAVSLPGAENSRGRSPSTVD